MCQVQTSGPFMHHVDINPTNSLEDLKPPKAMGGKNVYHESYSGLPVGPGFVLLCHASMRRVHDVDQGSSQRKGTAGSHRIPDADRRSPGALAVTNTPPPGAVEEGTASFGLTSHPLFFDLSLRPPSPEIPFRLEFDGEPAAEFRLWLRLAAAAPAVKLFSFVQRACCSALIYVS